MAGAEHHEAKFCTQRHIIRPVLFTFFQHGTSELKNFVKENLGVSVWEDGMEAYTKWLTIPPGNDAPNHLKLYWWILMFWRRLPQ